MKPKSMYSFFILLFIIALNSLFAFENERGPGFHRNPVLNQFIFFEFYPQKASLGEKKFNLIQSISHSSIIRMRNSLDYIAFSDMEISHYSLNPSYNVSKNFEISINVGFLYYWDGLLDSLVNWYHYRFGFPHGQRKLVENFNVTYQLGDHQNLIVDRHKNTFSLRDTSLMLRYQLLKSTESSSIKDYAIALASAIKFPSGKKRFGTSSGNYDFGLAIYLEKGLFSNNLYLYYMTSIIQLGKYKAVDTQMPIKKHKNQHSLSLEIHPQNSISLIAQIDYSSSPYKTNTNVFLDRAPINLILGINFLKNKRKNSMWQFLFTEDITHKTTPDFMFKLAVFQGF